MNAIQGSIRGPARVLIVDDFRLNVRLLEAMLSTEGYALLTAASGHEALAMVAKAPPDLILLDMMMNGIDGLQVATMLKGATATRNIPIIMVTVRDDREAKMLGLKAGAEDFLSKPVDRAELCVRVRNLLRLKAYGDYHTKYGQLLEGQVGASNSALMESEARFRRIVETTSEGVWQFDVAKKTTFMNGRMAEMLGYELQELSESSPADFLDEAGAAIFAASTQSLNAGRSIQVELGFKKSCGGTLWALVEASPILDLHGSMVGALAMVMDITARKRSEERKAAVVGASFDAVLSMDAEGTITEFNPAAERMFGYTAAEAIGAKMADLIIPPRLREIHLRSLERYLKTGEVRVIGKRQESTAIGRDGVEFPVELSVARVASDMATNFVGFVRDISERKRVERALVERAHTAALSADVGAALTGTGTLAVLLQRSCAAVVNNLDAAFARIWILNSATNMLDLKASAGMYTHTDGSHAHVPLGHLKIGRIGEERRAHVSNDVQHDPQVSDPEWARAEGMRSFAGHPLLVGGELVGVLAMFSREPLSDVVLTGLASIADAIAVRIHDKGVEHTNKALEEQLRQSQKMDAVGRLAGGVAHDFNNLLSVVLSYSEMLIADLKVGDPVREDLEEIHSAGVRAADLTRQLLLFSRQQVIEPKVLDLNDVLANMDKMLRRLLGEDVDLTSVPGAQLGRVRVDPGSIEQVIMNLVINARDAMPKGGRLTLETSNVVLDEQFASTHLGATAGPHVLLAVTDAGTGMDKATQARIFEPFFTTKELGKGTGLGLSTVFGIVRQSGGNVWVYSEPDVGTTFKVYLPRVDDVADASTPRLAPATVRGTETILLVEDEDPVRAVALGILRRHGYTVIEARNAGEALLVCERHADTIHLLLSDVVMPQMSGPELAKRLVRGRPEMKVLCMSGYTDDAAVRHGVVDSELAYLQKPLTVDTLTRKVRSVLDAPRVHR